MDVDGPFFSHQLFQVVEATKAESIVRMRFLVYDIDKATNTMVDKLRVLMYAVCISCNNLPKVFIITQVITSFASATSSNNTSTRV